MFSKIFIEINIKHTVYAGLWLSSHRQTYEIWNEATTDSKYDTYMAVNGKSIKHIQPQGQPNGKSCDRDVDR